MFTCPQRVPTSTPKQKDLEEPEGFENEPDELDVLADLGVDEDDDTTDLDVGIFINEPQGDGSDDAAATELDLGELLQPEPGTPEGATDDEAGPTELDLELGIEPAPEEADVGDEEGAKEPEFTVDESELPSLDADETDTETVQDSEGLITTDRDEEAPAAALKLWPEEGPFLNGELCSALVVSRGVVVAGNTDVFWIDSNDSPSRAAVTNSTITSLALCGSSSDVVLCATRAGELLRRSRFASSPEVLRALHESAEALTKAPINLLAELSCGEIVLALLANGILARSVDSGDSWMKVESVGKVLALAGAGQRAYALSVINGQPALVHSDAAGRFWHALPLPNELRSSIGNGVPLLTGSGETVAIAPSGRSLWVSSDSGANFQKVKGTADTTALAAGVMGERACVWAARYLEWEDRSDVILIDAALGEALCIARFEAEPSEEDLDSGDQLDQSRVHHLGWDGTTQRLWAAGAFGLIRFVPPRAHDS